MFSKFWPQLIFRRQLFKIWEPCNNSVDTNSGGIKTAFWKTVLSHEVLFNEMSQAGHWVTLGETVQRDIVVYFSKTGNEKLYKRLPMEKKKDCLWTASSTLIFTFHLITLKKRIWFLNNKNITSRETCNIYNTSNSNTSL